LRAALLQPGQAACGNFSNSVEVLWERVELAPDLCHAVDNFLHHLAHRWHLAAATGRGGSGILDCLLQERELFVRRQLGRVLGGVLPPVIPGIGERPEREK